MGMTFYFTADCTECDEEVIYGPCMTTLESEDGLPMIPFDMAAQTAFSCDSCGAASYTGDFDLLGKDEV